MISRLSERGRRAQAQATGGEPVLDFGDKRAPYIEYGEFDLLLSLQKPRTASRHELLFITSGQLMELLFKLTANELSHVQDQLRANDVRGAILTLERVIRIEEMLVKAWDMVGTLTSDQFLEFRDELGAASGIQSPGHRRLEFLLGNKDPEMLRPHRGYPDAYSALERGLNEPSVYDDALALLARRGYDIAREHLRRDLAAPYQPHPSVEAAWLAAYTEQGAGDDMHRLADALTSVADLWKQWRHRHLVTVARVIGHKPGNGGTSGWIGCAVSANWRSFRSYGRCGHACDTRHPREDLTDHGNERRQTSWER